MSSTAAIIAIDSARPPTGLGDRWHRRYTSKRWEWSRRNRVRKTLAIAAALWTAISFRIQDMPQGVDVWFAVAAASVLIWLMFMYALLQSTNGVLARRARDLTLEQRTVRWRAHSITYRVLINLFGIFVVSPQFALEFIHNTNLVVLTFTIAAVAAAWMSGETR